jgi:hypothetical protein
MRRLSIKLTCVLALLPALALGGCMKSESGAAYADAKMEARDMAGPSSGAHGGGDYGDYLAEAPAPSEEAAAAPGTMGEAKMGGMAMDDGEMAPPTSVAPSPATAVGTGSRGETKSKASGTVAAERSDAKMAKGDKDGGGAKIAKK